MNSELDYLQPLHETFLQLNQEYQDLEQLVDELFGEIDRLRLQLAHAQQTVAQERSLRTAVEEQFQLQTAGFEKLNGHVDRQNELLQQMYQKMEAGLNALDREATALPDAERSQLQEELLNVRRDRDAMAAELDQMRQQSSEMATTYEQQQQEMLVNQLTNSDQLQEMRALIEQLGELGRHARDAVRTTGSTRTEESEPSSGEEPDGSRDPADPVVHSVVAQFAKLQKDAAKRRRPSP